MVEIVALFFLYRSYHPLSVLLVVPKGGGSLEAWRITRIRILKCHGRINACSDDAWGVSCRRLPSRRRRRSCACWVCRATGCRHGSAGVRYFHVFGLCCQNLYRVLRLGLPSGGSRLPCPRCLGGNGHDQLRCGQLGCRNHYLAGRSGIPGSRWVG